MKLMLKSKTFLAACAVSCVMPLASAHAVIDAPEAKIFDIALIEEVGGAERINFSGKLRMLSQRIPSAACHLNADVAVDAASDLMKSATAEFQLILNGLEHGEESLGIYGAETRRKTLHAIGKVHEEWDPIVTRIEHLIEAGHDTDDVAHLAEHNMPLLAAAKLLVTELSGQYSDPTAILQADAIRLDIAGRQRMLTQKMAKEACFAKTDIGKEASLKAMKGTMDMFDVSLNALQNGMPAAGIAAPTEPNIIEGLKQVQADWAEVKTHLEDMAGGQTWDNATWEKVFLGLNKTMKDMNDVVGMFAEASKLDI